MHKEYDIEKVSKVDENIYEFISKHLKSSVKKIVY